MSRSWEGWEGRKSLKEMCLFAEIHARFLSPESISPGPFHQACFTWHQPYFRSSWKEPRSFHLFAERQQTFTASKARFYLQYFNLLPEPRALLYPHQRRAGRFPPAPTALLRLRPSPAVTQRRLLFF